MAMMLGWFLFGGAQVPVASNGLHPKLATHLKLTPELVIGPDQLPAQQWFPGIEVTVDVDRQGRMYVADGRNCRVLVFDPKGRLLRQIGRRGEGPGEFVALRRFVPLVQGGAIAFDCMQQVTRLDFFDSQFKFLNRRERAATGFRLKEWSCAPSGQLFACELVHIELATRTIHTRLVITDRDQRERATVGEYREAEFDMARVREPSYWTRYLEAYFVRQLQGQKGYFSFDGQGRLYSALGQAYEITRWDARGSKELTITRQYRPIPVSAKGAEAMVDEEHARILSEIPTELHGVVTRGVVARAFDRANLPRIKPPLFGLIAMEKGVIAIHDQDLAQNLSRGDIFDESGTYLGELVHESWGLRNMIFRNGNAYTIERNGEEDNQLVRYRVSFSKKSP